MLTGTEEPTVGADRGEGLGAGAGQLYGPPNCLPPSSPRRPAGQDCPSLLPNTPGLVDRGGQTCPVSAVQIRCCGTLTLLTPCSWLAVAGQSSPEGVCVMGF